MIYFFHDRIINRHTLSLKQKVFKNNTLEQCLSLQENGEEEIQHWLLLLSNLFYSRCAGDSGGVCQHTMQGEKQYSIMILLKNESPSPKLSLSFQFSMISILEFKIIWSNL